LPTISHFTRAAAAFESYYFVALLPLGLVDVHHNDLRLGPVHLRENVLDEHTCRVTANAFF
jgi:hypothetical protein